VRWRTYTIFSGRLHSATEALQAYRWHQWLHRSCVWVGRKLVGNSEIRTSCSVASISKRTPMGKLPQHRCGGTESPRQTLSLTFALNQRSADSTCGGPLTGRSLVSGYFCKANLGPWTTKARCRRGGVGLGFWAAVNPNYAVLGLHLN